MKLLDYGTDEDMLERAIQDSDKDDDTELKTLSINLVKMLTHKHMQWQVQLVEQCTIHNIK